MKYLDLVVHVLFLCVVPRLTDCARSLIRVRHSADARSSEGNPHKLHRHGRSDVINTSHPVMMNHGRVLVNRGGVSGEKQDSAMAHGPVYDESLEYTFRGDDFLESSTWRSKPRVNACKNVRSLSNTQAHKCDLLEMQMFVQTASSTTERFYSREFVGPYPNEDQIKRLREGPLRDLAAQKTLRRVTFVAHGYQRGTSRPGAWEARLGQELAKGGFGEDACIVIEWTRGAQASWEDCHGLECLDDYAVAMADARIVGKYIQRLAAGVRQVVGNVNFGCIGHSVGAHVCGFASKYMKLEDLPGGKLHMSRISGLDPAGPSHSLVVEVHSVLGGRSFVDPGYKFARLNKSDADFVDVYISDPGGFGYDITMSVEQQGRSEVAESDMLGHVTFLLNGRHYAAHKDFQPGCEKNTFKVGCSHHVAIDLYIDSLVSRQELLEQHHSDEGGMLRSFSDHLILNYPHLHPHTASHTASVVILCILLAVIFISGAILYWYFRILLFYLKVILIVVIVIFGIAAIAWVSHRHGPSKPSAALLKERASQTSENVGQATLSMQDYCEGLPMDRTLARCKLPFSVNDGHSGSTCPDFAEQKVSFGICAGPKSPEGLYLASVEADPDD